MGGGWVAVGSIVKVGVGVGVSVRGTAVSVGEATRVAVSVGEAARVAVSVGVGVSVGSWVAVGVSVVVASRVAVAVGVSVVVAVAEGEAVGVGLTVGKVVAVPSSRVGVWNCAGVGGRVTVGMPDVGSGVTVAIGVIEAIPAAGVSDGVGDKTEGEGKVGGITPLSPLGAANKATIPIQ